MISEMSRNIFNAIKWFIHYPLYKIRNNRVFINSNISNNVFLRSTSVGKYCYIGSNCDISYATIGNYTCIANNVVIGGMEHPHWSLSISPKLCDNFVYGKRTYIGNDVWIATGCIIKQGVTIGDGAVIGAGSFVNKDVEPYSIVVGNPAKLLKYRNCKGKEKTLRDSQYWNFSPNKACEILNKIRDNE